MAEAGKGVCVSAELIYSLEDRPTPQCHASTIVETQSGMVAAWFAGTHEKNPDVGIRVARHDGEKWLPSVEVADGVQSDDLRYPCWNPVLFQPTGGPLMLFYKVGPSPSQWWGMLGYLDLHPGQGFTGKINLGGWAHPGSQNVPRICLAHIKVWLLAVFTYHKGAAIL